MKLFQMPTQLKYLVTDGPALPGRADLIQRMNQWRPIDFMILLQDVVVSKFLPPETAKFMRLADFFPFARILSSRKKSFRVQVDEKTKPRAQVPARTTLPDC